MRPNVEHQEDPTPDQTAEQTTNETDDRTLLLDSLRSQVEFLQEELKRREEVHVEENRRKDTIIAQLTQRIPELEPPKEATQEPRESPETASESPTTSREWPLGHEGETYGTSAQEAEDSLQRRPSWWRRFFGLE